MTLIMMASAAVMSLLDCALAELAPHRSLSEMSVSCSPSHIMISEGLQCRWEPRFKNDSSLETWLTTHVWTVYIVLSLVVAFELLCSSYLSGFIFEDDDEDDFNLTFPDDDIEDDEER